MGGRGGDAKRLAVMVWLEGESRVRSGGSADRSLTMFERFNANVTLKLTIREAE